MFVDYKDRRSGRLSWNYGIPPCHSLAMQCDPDLAVAMAIASWDHWLDSYRGEALILIFILAIA